LSSGFLLDTSVLSMLAPNKPAPDETLAIWVRNHADRIYLSAVTIAEIEQGICKLRRAGGEMRADRLSHWLDSLLDAESTQILALDGKVGRVAGGLSDRAIAAGRHPGFPDVAIAATAIAHDMILVTRNGKHFEPLDVAFIDPRDGLP
jgi:predicted nucleic acid-binding protein